MSEQENQNSIQCSDGLVRKEWYKPVIVELLEANGGGAEGKFFNSPGETRTFSSIGPS